MPTEGDSLLRRFDRRGLLCRLGLSLVPSASVFLRPSFPAPALAQTESGVNKTQTAERTAPSGVAVIFWLCIDCLNASPEKGRRFPAAKRWGRPLHGDLVAQKPFGTHDRRNGAIPWILKICLTNAHHRI